MSTDYTYDDYLQSGEVRNPMGVEPQPETNEYTNNEIRDNLDGNNDKNNDEGNDYYNGYGY